MKMDNLEATTSGFDVVTRLDENYLFLLQFVDRPMSETSLEQQKLAKKWLLKLGTEVDMQSCADKLKRNNYLSELIHCMQERILSPPFNAPPPQGHLDAIDFNTSWLAGQREQPKWLDQLMNEEANKVHVGGKNFETYLSTKLFEDGRGACAYIAVSAQNEGDEAAWVRIQPNKKKEDVIDQMFQKEMKNYLRDNE